jgi:hypothetical protein
LATPVEEFRGAARAACTAVMVEASAAGVAEVVLAVAALAAAVVDSVAAVRRGDGK